MNSDHIITFLKSHPLISQRAIETQVGMPQATLRHSMAGRRNIPKKYIPDLCEILKEYGFTADKPL
jgi:hypothetical protein